MWSDKFSKYVKVGSAEFWKDYCTQASVEQLKSLLDKLSEQEKSDVLDGCASNANINLV